MWFDAIIVDNIRLDGVLTTHHIRSRTADRVATDLLEQIDVEIQGGDATDIGPLRMYKPNDANITVFETRLKNIGLNADSTELFVQLDHFGIQVTAGYYACVFPIGWRVIDINVYDPYSDKENVAENRTYRDISYIWDPASRLSSAQFEMLSNRGTFSLGVIAKLARDNSGNSFAELEKPVSIIFTDPRHQDHPLEKEFREASEAVVSEIQQGQSSMSETLPPINVGLTGPSIDIVAWGRFIKNKVRRPKR